MPNRWFWTDVVVCVCIQRHRLPPSSKWSQKLLMKWSPSGQGTVLKKQKTKKLFYTMWNKLKQGSIILTFPSQLSFLTLLLLVNLEMYPELVNSLVSLASLCLPCLDHSLKFQVTCLRSTNTFTCLPEYSIAKAQIFHFYQHLIPSLCLNFPRLFI